MDRAYLGTKMFLLPVARHPLGILQAWTDPHE
jgi:hypothetical protein